MERVIKLHVHYLTEPKGQVWAVDTQGRYRICRAVRVYIPPETVFRGPNARQPKAYLKGKGIVRKGKDGVLELRPY
jgi:hypothetical protein